jgi:hypothetical protein
MVFGMMIRGHQFEMMTIVTANSKTFINKCLYTLRHHLAYEEELNGAFNLHYVYLYYFLLPNRNILC